MAMEQEDAQKKEFDELKSEVGEVVPMAESKQYLVLIFFLAGHCWPEEALMRFWRV